MKKKRARGTRNDQSLSAYLHMHTNLGRRWLAEGTNCAYQ